MLLSRVFDVTCTTRLTLSDAVYGVRNYSANYAETARRLLSDLKDLKGPSDVKESSVDTSASEEFVDAHDQDEIFEDVNDVVILEDDKSEGGKGKNKSETQLTVGNGEVKIALSKDEESDLTQTIVNKLANLFIKRQK